jgi:hypothetical protein
MQEENWIPVGDVIAPGGELGASLPTEFLDQPTGDIIDQLEATGLFGSDALKRPSCGRG